MVFPDPHLIDEIITALGTFSVFDARAVQVRGLCLSFYAPLFEARRTQIADSITRVSSSGDMVVGLAFWDHPHVLNPRRRCVAGRAWRWSSGISVTFERSRDEPDRALSLRFAGWGAVAAGCPRISDMSAWRPRFVQGVSCVLYLWNRRPSSRAAMATVVLFSA